MKTILFFKATEYTPARMRLAGAKRAAQILGFRVIPIDSFENNRESIPRLVDFWNPAGIIIDCSLFTKGPTLPAQLRIPAVHLGLRFSPRKPLFSVHANRRDVVHAAAQELLLLDYPGYAYVGHPKSPEWSRERCRIFRETIALHGRKFSAFERGCREDGLAHSKRLRDWLAGLPKPCGVFAANDIVANHILDQCLALGIRVPNDIAVVGVDNDETICCSTHPPLTSVVPDMERIGYEAMKLLSHIIRNPRLKPCSVEAGGALTVVRRASSRARLVYPSDVAKAIGLIREKACEGLRSRDVIAVMHGSRRTCEQAFRTAIGHSILDEIQSVRMERARDLLSSSTHSVTSVANLCSYASLSAFTKQYRKAYGTTPRKTDKAHEVGGLDSVQKPSKRRNGMISSK